MKEKKRKISKLKIFIFVLIILAIILGLFLKRVYDLKGNWIAAAMGHDEETLKNLDRLTVLVLGESEENTDTLMLFTYDPKTQSAGMLSIPRDTFVGENIKNPTSKDKINSLCRLEGPEATVEAVNRLTGLDIKYYLKIDTKGLIKFVDTIGGIDFDVPIDMKYTDEGQDLYINLAAGYQHLNGQQVEWLVRFRHNDDGSTYSWQYGDNDYGRMRTQREVIKTVAKQTIKFKNIAELRNIIDIFNEYIETNLDFGLIKDYVPYVVQMNLEPDPENPEKEAIKSEQLPGRSEKVNDFIWLFIHDPKETEKAIDRIFDRIEPVQDETVTDETINNTVQ